MLEMADSEALRLGRLRFTLQSLMAMIGLLALLIGGITLGMRTDAVRELCWLGSQAFEVGAYFFPWFTWAAGAGILVALVAAVSNKGTWHRRSLWLLTPLLVPVAILAYGVVFAYDHAPHDVIERRVGALDMLPWLHLPMAVVLIC
jgi:hypothetical protein